MKDKKKERFIKARENSIRFQEYKELDKKSDYVYLANSGIFLVHRQRNPKEVLHHSH
ncbi:MAG: hypothetical protein JST96_13400 [Bacteroidetes bacterium]|nr:hypothetical protein [Bacteroidota bacterium]